ncbi:MAG: hypothetical protein KA419_00725 [Acidobacteria bacterium]|nr:hypothetical protein [Acidobacteriota bacterium]
MTAHFPKTDRSNDFLSNRGILDICLIYFVLGLVELIVKFVLSRVMTSHQISGYYMSGLFLMIRTGVAVLWFSAIVRLFLREKPGKALFRLVLTPVIILTAEILLFFVHAFIPSGLSGWPLDSVYSKRRSQYFLLARDDTPTDWVYTLHSTRTTLFNPLWKKEYGSPPLDYSEDGSLTSNPRLFLSRDETILAIARGGRFTDAVNLDTGQALTGAVAWNEANREDLWRIRSEKVVKLLESHGGVTK